MSSKSFSFIVSIPGQEPVRHDLEGDSITIGRGPDNGIQVLVSEVSVQHGALEASGETYKIVDKGSTNGTKVNGAPVGGEGVELKPMDKVLFGDTISSYFVSTAVLDATPIGELIASIELTPKDSPKAVPSPVQPARPAVALPAQTPATGAATVRLDQVKPGAPAIGPAKPGGPRSVPSLPAPVKPGGGPAPAPGGPNPKAPIPLKKPGAPAAPTIPLPKTPPKPGE